MFYVPLAIRAKLDFPYRLFIGEIELFDYGVWGSMSSCARAAGPRCLRRLAIGAQVNNLPHALKLTQHLFTD